ncbi:CYTH domain-containing protein [Serinibacter salmoneus]|uniref:CYTH domain-containing protein n=1 Tax=Serinibacter salmoneus TaxID=556530 RepID=A0A2A9D2B5_9MICO|nr:CYTH domain-containing protein [Serinibacter salmoneus]PFG20476.1 CYTH domain-containing protein [Serinibacter salmoneus]
MSEFGDGIEAEREHLAQVRDFEFERRFLVTALAQELRDAPTLIVQSYYLADAGYALRVRVQASGVDLRVDEGTDALDALTHIEGEVDLATVTVKGPAIGGTRYETEHVLDPGVAVEMIRRGGAPIVKTRYSVWAGGDGWSVDVFGGLNAPLIIAECERSGPVTDLEIPAFCVTELTDDRRFSNESLATHPYGQWRAGYLSELARLGPRMREDFGRNERLP